MKKPASKVQKVSEAWKQSPSFGFVKATEATAKSYIVSRESMKENCHLLVMSQPMPPKATTKWLTS
jgi:hypothetical protein